MRSVIRRSLLALIALGGLGAIVYAFLPKPVEVDIAAVSRGPLMVTVDEDGKTRIKERYIVSTPLAGTLQRVDKDPGDMVIAGKTLLAAILPNNPELLDPRAREEAAARVNAAEASVNRAQANLEAALAARESAEREHERIRRLHERGAATDEELEDAELAMRTRQEEHRAAEFSLEIAQFEVEQVRAALKRFNEATEDGDVSEWQFDIYAPIDGQVLRVLQESSAVLPAGTPLMEVGDPRNLELEIDVLSTDAVKISPGDTVLIEHWGGDRVLKGRVRLVEPAAFTKISALGVEEQRVNVIADLTDESAQESNLGDGFRFEARIVIWESADVLQVPTAALFRHREDWAVYVIGEGHATLRIVQLGHKNPDAAEVLDGLDEGERVIVYPSDRIESGVAVVPRATGD